MDKAYADNLSSLREQFPYRRYISQKEMREYLGFGDNRTLARRYGIKKGCTLETFRRALAGKE